MNGPREFYLPARMIGNAANPLGWKGSADLFTLAQADALIIRPENDPAPGGCAVPDPAHKTLAIERNTELSAAFFLCRGVL